MTHVHKGFSDQAFITPGVEPRRRIFKPAAPVSAVVRCLSPAAPDLNLTRGSGGTAMILETRGNTAQTRNLDIGKQRRHRPMSAS